MSETKAIRRDLANAPSCLRGEGVTRYFHTGKITTKAVDHVDFDFHEGELVSIVGESGSGKTTTARLLLKLIEPTAGSIRFEGKEISSLSRSETRSFRQRV